jgi:hypothetical protein
MKKNTAKTDWNYRGNYGELRGVVWGFSLNPHTFLEDFPYIFGEDGLDNIIL